MSLKYRVVERFRGKYRVQAMCDMFEVSRSGYYAWRNRQGKPGKDQWLVNLIIEGQHINKQTYGLPPDAAVVVRSERQKSQS